jgi:hypothetical protein
MNTLLHPHEAAAKLGLSEAGLVGLVESGAIVTPHKSGEALFFDADFIDGLARDLSAAEEEDRQLKINQLKQKPCPADRCVGAFVYFIHAGELVKIGTAKSIKNRMRALQSGCPHPMRLVHFVSGSKTAERKFHKMFSHLRAHLEWFKLDDDLLDYLLEASE